MITNKIYYFLFLILSLFLCFFAPSTYSYPYCLGIFIVFIIQNIVYFKQNEYKDKLVSFEFFFAFSFTLCNFIYPIIYFPIKPDIGIYSLWFNNSVMSFSTALAGLSYSSFLLGLVLFNKKSVKESKLTVNITFVKFVFFLSIISFMLFVFTGGLTHFKEVYSGEGGDLNQVGIYSYFNNIYSITILLLSMFVFKISSKILRYQILTYLLLSVLLVLFTGSRTIVIGVLLLLLVTFGVYKKRISKTMLGLGVILGSFLMNFVMLVRDKSSNNIYEKVSEFDIFLDLISTNRNLYVLVDFVDNNFKVYFVSALNDLVSPLPMISSYIKNLGFSTDVMGGAWTTFLEFGSGSKFGLGTNIVGEMYFAFGIYGVIFISFFLGLLIRKAKNNLDNIYYYVIYFLFVSHAIFYPRAFYLFQPRTIVWSLLIIYIYQFLFKKIFIKKK